MAMDGAKPFWHGYAETTGSVRDAENQHRARLLTFLLVLLFPLGLVAAALPAVFHGRPILDDWDFVVAAGGIAI